MRPALVLTVLAILALPIAGNALPHWTAVGGTGTIGPWALSWTNVSGVGMGYLSSSSSLNTIGIAYNVTGTADTDTPAWTTLEIGYTGVTSTSSITAVLYQVTPGTGGATSVCSVTSTTTASTQTCTFSSGTFDFSKYAYYVGVSINRTSSGSHPVINYVGIS